MGQQAINNGDSGLSTRTKINSNFTDLYNPLGVNAVVELYNEWLNAISSNFTLTNSGTGSFFGNGSSTNNEQGILGLNTGTTSSGTAHISTSVAGIQLGKGETVFETVINLPAISTPSERFIIYAGFGDSFTADPTDGVFFKYSDDVNGGKFQLVTSSNSTQSTSDSGVTVAAFTAYKLKIVINSLGTSAEFFINGISAGTIALNIPTAVGRQLGFITQIRKTVGTTAVSVNVDYSYLKITLTSPR